MKQIPLYSSSTPWTATLHTHSNFCDGKRKPDKYVKAAFDMGITTLGFSSHAPVPYPPGAEAIDVFWCMPIGAIYSYTETIRDLQQEHAGRLTVLTGLEIDYIPHVMGPRHPVFRAMNLDYTIGSVHVAGCREDGTMWTVDCGPEKFKTGLETLFSGSVERAGREYYRRIRDMVTQQPPDIIAHLDLFKKNNKEMGFLDESAHWYRETVFETLDCIAASGCIIEVNTGGMTRGFMDDPYPSLFILQRCRELNIPVMLNSDAHHPKNLTAGFDIASELLKKAGY